MSSLVQEATPIVLIYRADVGHRQNILATFAPCKSSWRISMAVNKIKYNDVRRNSVSITLSDRELAAIDEYCALFKKKSRSAVIREGAVRFAMEHIIDRRTSLFPDQVPELDADDDASATPRKRSAASDAMPSLFDFVDDEGL